MTDKRLEGRDEPILEPHLPIIDTHNHLYLRPTIRYLLDDFLDDAYAGHNIVATVYVNATSMYRPDGPELMRPLGEVEFANGMAAMSANGLFGKCRVAAAIVPHAEISAGDAVAAYLDAALARAPDRMRGVREITMFHPSEAIKPFIRYHCAPGIIASDRFREGFRHLQSRALSFEASVFHTQLGEVADLASAFPDTTIVVSHLGMALGLGLDAQGRKDTFDAWLRAIRNVASRPNVICKVGGLGVPYWGFGFERLADPVGYRALADAWRPYVEAAIAAFGAQRCMMESNFPPDSASCGYVPLWNALKHIVAGYSQDEKAQLFHRTAARIYQINLA